jgi:hypothetical protein
MLERFSLDNKLEMKAWDSFVESHPRATPFHSSAWLRTVCETYSFEPILYAYRNQDGLITAVFPCVIVKGITGGARIVSVPFSDYGGPIASTTLYEDDMLNAIRRGDGGTLRSLEIRGPVKCTGGFLCKNYYKRHLIDLSVGLSAVRKKIEKRTILYSIRKAERFGVVIQQENSVWGMKEFCRLNRLTRKKHGVPSQPDLFFEKVFDYVVAQGMGSIFLALSDSRVIAGGLFLKLRDTVYYKYNASDPEFLSQKTPNHLLTWHAIENAFQQGYRYLDFGRTSPDNEGLMRYKAMWGARGMELPYYYYPRITGATSKEGGGLSYSIITSLWRKLPYPITNWIGPRVFRYLA